MAYLLWCEETRDAREVLDLLSEARQAAKEPGMMKAVDVFSRGVSAAGGPQQPPDAETGQVSHPDRK